MKTPKSLQPLMDDGIIDEVLYAVLSGKEASVFAVRRGEDVLCAKVYKEAYKRSFKKAVQYQEGRKVRNSRQARAMGKRSKFGRDQQEEAWQHAEINALYKLQEAGVRVPKPFGCFNGVLLMELVTDEEGDVAPRLNDVSMSAEQAREDHAIMMHYIQLMLCAGLVHGDLSEFNVLVDDYGPVIIDLPQAVDAAANNNAHTMLTRDVNNITGYYAQFAPELLATRYGQEMWALFEDGELTPDTELSGQFQDDESAADVDAVMQAIKAALDEERERQARLKDDGEDPE